MNTDKTAIELWEKHSFDYHEPGVRDPVRVMIKDDFLAALSEVEGERAEIIKEAWGALNFILAFYDSDANRYLDTNAWKNAEASGRRVRAKLRELIAALPAPPKEKP